MTRHARIRHSVRPKVLRLVGVTSLVLALASGVTGLQTTRAKAALATPPAAVASPVHLATSASTTPTHANVTSLASSSAPAAPSALPGGGALDSVFSGLGQLNQVGNAAANTLFGFLTDGVCSVSGKVSPGFPCLVSLLQYTVHSVYEKPGGGEFVGNSFLLVEVPTPIDITGDGIPDVLVTVGLTNLNRVALTVNKLSTAPKILPASVELVARDPSNATSSSRIAFGYDQRTSTIPTRFSTSGTLKSFSPLELAVTVTQLGASSGLTLIASLFELKSNGTRQVQVAASVSFVPAPASMTYDILVGSSEERLIYTATAATKVTADVDLIDGPGEQTVHVVVDKLPNKVTVDLASTDTTHRTVTYAANAAIAHITLLYRNITHATGGDTLNTEVTGDIQNLPTGLVFKQNGPTSMSFATSGGAIGVVSGGIAHLQHVVPVPTTESGARVTMTDGAIDTASARLLGLSGVTVSAPAKGPYYADLQSTSQPLRAVYIDNETSPPSTTTIDAVVNNLPAHLTLNIDPNTGTVIEDGHGQIISKISVDAISTAVFFDRATHLHVDLFTIPAAFTLTYSTGNGGASANLSAPIGETDFYADDGAHSASVPAGVDGLTYHSLPSVYAMAGRIYGLTAFSFSSDTTTPDQPMKVAVTAAPGHLFDADVALHITDSTPAGKDMTLNATVDSLPSNITMTLTHNWTIITTVFGPLVVDDGLHVSYKANTSIKTITMDAIENPEFVALKPDASSPQAGDAPLTANHLHAVLSGIPAAFEFDLLTQPDGALTATMKPAVTQIDFYLDDGTSGHTLNLPGTAVLHSLALDRGLDGPTDSGISCYLRFGQFFAVAGRIYGLSLVSFQPAGKTPGHPLQAEVSTAGGHIFDLAAVLDQSIDTSTTALTAAAEIDTLPADVKLSMDSLAGPAPSYHGMKLDYQGSDSSGGPSSIARIEAYAEGPAFISDSAPTAHPTVPVNQAHFVYGKVLGLPARVTITSIPAQAEVCTNVDPIQPCSITKAVMDVNTYGATIGKVEFQALDNPARQLAYFPIWSNYAKDAPTSFLLNGSPDADGLVLHDLIDNSFQPVEFTLALQLSGLNGAHLDGSSSGPQDDPASVEDITHADLSVDKTLSQVFNLDVQTQTIDDTSHRESPINALEGFINKPQPGMHVTIHKNDHSQNFVGSGWSSTRLQFGANGCAGEGLACSVVGTAIDRIHLEDLQMPTPDGQGDAAIPGDQLNLDIGNIPNDLSVCMGSDDPVANDQIAGSTDRSGCLLDRPRPSGYPADQPTDPAQSQWGEFDANHSLVLNVDDFGTSGTDDSTAMTLNLYACTKVLTGLTYGGQMVNYTCDPSNFPTSTYDPNYRVNGPGAFAQITNLRIHNLLLDVYAEATSGALLSGHLGLDTRGQSISGSVGYNDQTLNVGVNGATSLLVNAGISFPDPFVANYRYTDFRNTPITPPGDKYDNEWGFVSCDSDHPVPPSTAMPSMGVRVQIKDSTNIPPTFNIDIAPRWLCHIA